MIWCKQLACKDDDHIMHRGRTRQKKCAEFTRQVHNGLNRLRSHVSTASYNMFFYLNHGEMGYLLALKGITTSNIEEWLDMAFVEWDAWVRLNAQLRVDFRYNRRTTFRDGCNEERW